MRAVTVPSDSYDKAHHNNNNNNNKTVLLEFTNLQKLPPTETVTFLLSLICLL